MCSLVSCSRRPKLEGAPRGDGSYLRTPLTRCDTDNAGMVLGTDHVGQIAEEDVEQMFDTNVLGLISLTQLFVNSESSSPPFLRTTWSKSKERR